MGGNSRQGGRGLNTNSKRWRQIRAQVLAEQPLCLMCERLGKIEPAVDVDHIDNDSHNQSRENLQGLCRSHHAAKSFAEAQGWTFTLKGCGPDGWPVHRDD